MGFMTGICGVQRVSDRIEYTQFVFFIEDGWMVIIGGRSTRVIVDSHGNYNVMVYYYFVKTYYLKYFYC